MNAWRGVGGTSSDTSEGECMEGGRGYVVGYKRGRMHGGESGSHDRQKQMKDDERTVVGACVTLTWSGDGGTDRATAASSL